MLTQTQLENRRTGIGGSDAAAILGRSRYSTPLDIYISKTTNIVTEPNGAMKRGNILEPFVRSLFEHKTGFKVDSVTDTIRSKKHNFMIANIDGYIPSERAILEIKTADISKISEWGEENSDEMPYEYIYQDSHYGCVTEVDSVYTAVLFATKERFDDLCKVQNLIEEGHHINFDEHDLIFKLYKYNYFKIAPDIDLDKKNY